MTRDVANLIAIIADIREKSGVGAKPMLNELADAIAAKINIAWEARHDWFAAAGTANRRRQAAEARVETLDAALRGLLTQIETPTKAAGWAVQTDAAVRAARAALAEAR